MTAYEANGTRTQTTTRRDGTRTVISFTDGRITSQEAQDALGGQLWKQSFEYDTDGRCYRTIDSRNDTTTLTFNNADQVATVTTPSPGNGLPTQVTTTLYDDLGRVTGVIRPDGTSVTNDYFATGLLKKTYGSQTYPVEYTYDAQGRMKTMTMWQDWGTSSGVSGAAVTEWFYHPERGWLEKKQYPGETDATNDYTCTAGGRLKTRVWERGINKTIGDGLFELRHVGKLNTRILWFFMEGRRIVLVHGIGNKGRSIPIHDRNTARSRMNDWLNHQEK